MFVFWVIHVFCKMMGYSEGELLKLSIKDLTATIDIDASNKLITNVIARAGSQDTLEKTYVRKDKSEFFGLVKVNAKKFPNGEIYNVAVTVDVSKGHESVIEIEKSRVSIA